MEHAVTSIIDHLITMHALDNVTVNGNRQQAANTLRLCVGVKVKSPTCACARTVGKARRPYLG